MKERPAQQEQAPVITEEISGIKIKPKAQKEISEERTDTERRHRLIVGTTKQILKIFYQERDLIQDIISTENQLSLANDDVYKSEPDGFFQSLFQPSEIRVKYRTAKSESERLQKKLIALDQTYQSAFAKINSRGEPLENHPNILKRLHALTDIIAKQEEILEREQKHLKISRSQGPASKR